MVRVFDSWPKKVRGSNPNAILVTTGSIPTADHVIPSLFQATVLPVFTLLSVKGQARNKNRPIFTTAVPCHACSVCL